MKRSQNSLSKADTSVRTLAESGILGLVHANSMNAGNITLCDMAKRREIGTMRPYHLFMAGYAPIRWRGSSRGDLQLGGWYGLCGEGRRAGRLRLEQPGTAGQRQQRS